MSFLYILTRHSTLSWRRNNRINGLRNSVHNIHHVSFRLSDLSRFTQLIFRKENWHVIFLFRRNERLQNDRTILSNQNGDFWLLWRELHPDGLTATPITHFLLLSPYRVLMTTARAVSSFLRVGASYVMLHLYLVAYLFTLSSFSYSLPHFSLPTTTLW